MEFLLIIPVVYLIIETVLGYKRGLIKSVLLLLSWIVSLTAAGFLVKEFVEKTDKMEEFSQYFIGITGPEYADIAVCVSIFLLLIVFLKICFHIIIHLTGAVENMPVVGKTNQVLGAVFGLLKGVLVAAVASLVFLIYNGMYINEMWSQFPELMRLLQQGEYYLRQLWTIYL